MSNKAREYYIKRYKGDPSNMQDWFRFTQAYADHQSTSQKETIERLRDILQETTETLMAVRRHGLREEEGYETVVTLVGETIHESEQLLKKTEQ